MDHLHRSMQNRKIAGIAAGMAEFFDVDVALMRLVWVLSFFAGGLGLLAYIAAWVIIPEDDSEGSRDITNNTQIGLDQDALNNRMAARRRNAGLIIIGLGLIFLIDNIIPWHYWNKGWPLLLVVMGLYIVFRDRGGQRG